MSTLGLERYSDRCARGFHLATQHPDLCSCQGEQGKAEGIARTTAAASTDERARIDAAIRKVAARGVEFSANDVRPLIADAHGPLVGARFNALARAGIIRDTGVRVKSTQAATHAHEVRVWVGAAA